MLMEGEPRNYVEVRLTGGAATNGYLPLPKECAIFEPQHYGGKDDREAGRMFRLSLPDGEEIQTDIRKVGGSSRIRSRFYVLFRKFGAVEGTIIRVMRLGPDHYQMIIVEEAKNPMVIRIDEALLAKAVDARIRPALIDEGGLDNIKDEGYQHQKVLPKARSLLSREAISEDPLGSVKGALQAHFNLLSQFELAKAVDFLKICEAGEAKVKFLALLYGADDLEERARNFLDWAGTEHHKVDGSSVGFNPTTVSYLLNAVDPTKYAFCKPDNYSRAAAALLGAGAVEKDSIKRLIHATAFYAEALRLFRDEHDLPFEDLMHVHIAFWVVRNGTPTWDDLRDGVSEAGVTPPDTPLEVMGENIILYGPPGTGKTYHLRNNYLQNYISESASVSQEAWLETQLRDRPWLDVIAAALHDLGGGPVSVTDILNHRFVQAAAKSRGLGKVLRNTIWSYLQHHTAADCPYVKLENRRGPSWFWKDSDGRWSFTTDWQEEGAQVTELAARLNDGPPEDGEVIRRYEFVTFHQSYSYEEFVEGIRPVLEAGDNADSQLSYLLSAGVFRRICDRARRDPTQRYALFIDEINRGNIAKIFGELITLVELDKREGASNSIAVRLPYSKEEFSVPRNLEIIGTMNTADRSLAHIDTALRRRFRFRELMPEPHLLDEVEFNGVLIDLRLLLEAINRRIEAIFDREHTIGHAYFLRNKGEVIPGQELPDIFRHNIIPLLTEYFYDDWSRVRFVLADDQCDDMPELQFVRGIEVNDDLVPKGSGFRAKRLFQLNPEALGNPKAYLKIYATS